MKIFIIEDEPAIREELVQLLQKYGYQCDSSGDFHHIVQAALSSGANLILLDINLPYQDGFQVCREIRQKSNLPIIVLTSRNSDFDELMSLNIGADDYIAKPYNAQILLARIQKILARTYEVQDNIVLTHKGLTLNLLKAEISYQGNKKSLTKNELGILRLLMVNKGNIIPRDAIIDELWQSEQFIDENTLNVNIVRLRKALTEIGLPDYLETKRGLGYCVYPYQMSGGQQQRVAAARAMVTNPAIVLADEPTGALDSNSSRMLLTMLTELNERLSATILMVTHDAFSASYCNRILFIKDGQVFNELHRGTDTRKEFFTKICNAL